jgi:hypothetical protein
VSKRFRLFCHVALTVIAFATTGRAPRLETAAPRELASAEARVTALVDPSRPR